MAYYNERKKVSGAGGGTIASLLAYVSEKKMSKNPEQFGKGAIKGIAAPESANNAASGGAFVPLLSLGIPGSGTTACDARCINGVRGATRSIINWRSSRYFLGSYYKYVYRNIFLLILNLPLIPYISKILKVPRPMLIPLVIVFCLIGVYGVSFNTFDMFLLLLFGIIGYVMRLFHFPAAPLLLAFILGGMMEQSFRQSLTISNGSLAIFFTNPISCVLLIIALLAFLLPIFKNMEKEKRR